MCPGEVLKHITEEDCTELHRYTQKHDVVQVWASQSDNPEQEDNGNFIHQLVGHTILSDAA